VTGFSRHPVVKVLPDGATFEMVQAVTYYGSQGDRWVIPKGFRTDFATIPAAVSWAVPKLGAYTLAAIVHDLLCEGLNAWHDGERLVGLPYWKNPVPRPTASAVDTDAIFYRIARAHGVNVVLAALLWVGVRWGALANPARREGWLRTAPKVLALSVLLAPLLVPGAVGAILGRLGLRALAALLRLGGLR
jgi:hypothetical protein